MDKKGTAATICPRPRWLIVMLFRCLTAVGIVLNMACPTCPAQSVVLVGVGSTVPLPLYKKWGEEYNKRDQKFQMRYLPLGTSEGISLVVQKSGDFGAGEVPLGANQPNAATLTAMPTALIGIVPIYNLPGVRGDLRFSGDLLAEIFLGQVKTWNSPAIAKLNPDLSLPNLPIRVVYRPAGKGSNYVFTDFLSKASSRFRSRIGVTASPNWPVRESAERSADMVLKVKNEPGSIGYVELQYAVDMHVAYGLVQNASGSYSRASNQTITAACEAVESPRWDRFSASLTDAPGPASYPITSFTWIYLPTQTGDPGHAATLTDLLGWIFGDGQRIAGDLGYSPLPVPLLRKVQARVSQLH